jgi:hypothetical protein
MKLVYPDNYPQLTNIGNTGGSDAFRAPVFYSDEEVQAMNPNTGKGSVMDEEEFQFYKPELEVMTGFKESKDYFDAVADLQAFVTDLKFKGYEPGRVDIRRPETLQANQMLNEKIKNIKYQEARLKSLKKVYDDQLAKDKLTKKLPVDPNTGLPILGESNEYFETDIVPENRTLEAANRAYGGKQFYGGEYSQAAREYARNAQAIEEEKAALVAQGYDPQAVERAYSGRLQAPIRQEVMPTFSKSGGSPDSPNAPENPFAPRMGGFTFGMGNYPVKNSAGEIEGSGKTYNVEAIASMPIGQQKPITTNAVTMMSRGKTPKKTSKSLEVSFSNVAIVPVIERNGQIYVLPNDKIEDAIKKGYKPTYKPMVFGANKFKDEKDNEIIREVYAPLEDVEAAIVGAAGSKDKANAIKYGLNQLKDGANQYNQQLGTKGAKQTQAPKNDDDNDALARKYGLIQ